MKKKHLILFLLSSLFSFSQNEKKVDHQSILWTRYYNQLTLNNKWSVHTEFDNRVFLKPIAENLFVFRIQGRYKINSAVEVGSGFTYFSVYTQDPNKNFGFEIPEYRGQQDITYKKNYNKITINQRFQIEERFIHNASKTKLLEGTTFNWRFRYRLQAEYPVWEKQNKYLKAIVYDEILINAGKNIVYNTFDQNRIYGALQYGFNKNIAVELGYLKSFQQRPSGIDYFDRDIIRLSVFHKIHL
ncbi:DUF2490 domain-containing protein [Flavobacterium sp. TSSA_36]|uniref:DUF2490 domain-containing protein n=1 Tax=Flavobacterium sp. TSSA_36 TaxID=3447669 RepID=UPI003F2F2701